MSCLRRRRRFLCLPGLAVLVALAAGACDHPSTAGGADVPAIASRPADPRADALRFWGSLDSATTRRINAMAQVGLGPELDAWYRGWNAWAIPLLWLALLALAVTGVVTRLGRDRPSGLTLALWGAAAAGLVLRLVATTECPADHRSHTMFALAGPDALAGALRYGSGTEGLLLGLFALLGAYPWVAVAANMVAAALTIVLTGALARRLGMGSWPAVAAALLVAAMPLHVHFSMTSERYILPGMLLLAGWTVLLRYLDEGRLADLVLAFLALALAPHCSPELYYTPALTALLVLWRLRARVAPPPRGSLRLVLLGFAVHCVLLLPGLGTVLASLDRPLVRGAFTLSGLLHVVSPERSGFLSGEYTPALWVLLAAVGLFARPGQTRWTSAWLAGGGLLATFPLAGLLVNGSISTGRYHVIPSLLYLLLAAAGLGVVFRVATSAAARVVVLALTLGASAWVLPGVVAPRTMCVEDRFLREHLAAVPDGCRVLHFAPPSPDFGYIPDELTSLQAGRRHTWQNGKEPLEAERSDCVAYYRGSTCAIELPDESPTVAAWRRRACEEAMDLVVAPIAETRAVARSFSQIGRFKEAEVPVGLYWLRRPQ